MLQPTGDAEGLGFRGGAADATPAALQAARVRRRVHIARAHIVTLMHTRDRTQGEASNVSGEWNVTEEPTTGQPYTVRTHTHFHACTHACMHAITHT